MNRLDDAQFVGLCLTVAAGVVLAVVDFFATATVAGGIARGIGILCALVFLAVAAAFIWGAADRRKSTMYIDRTR